MSAPPRPEPPVIVRAAGATDLAPRGWIYLHWSKVLVVGVALILWIPRLTGPIDLRWDGGVYYLLGSSLATGHGYRLTNEPGSPEAVQYPPLLPVFIAALQRFSATSDPAIIAPRLRLFYAVIFLAYSLAVLALARQYLPVALAAMVTILSLLHHLTVFFSDLLFADLPFALASVLFAIIAFSSADQPAPRKEIIAFLFALVAFAFRTMGLALFAAWVGQALLGGRWKLALARCGLAVLPIIAWEAYVLRVNRNNEFTHPAYEYQRADYQYSNVTYVANALMTNPFRPELGRVDTIGLGKRLLENLPWLTMAAGEELCAAALSWPSLDLKTRLFRHGAPATVDQAEGFALGSHERSFRSLYGFKAVPLAALALILGAGVVIACRQKRWLLFLIITTTLVMVWATPWRIQFTRYLVPIMPFLFIAATLGYLRFYQVVPRSGLLRSLLRAALILLLVGAVFLNLFGTVKWFRLRSSAAGLSLAKALSHQARFFAHDVTWQRWEVAANWIATHSEQTAIVATSAPHLLYLLTQRQAVLPPMEVDSKRELQLLTAVPVDFVIIDEVNSLDVTRHYALPAISQAPDWRLMYSDRATSVYHWQSTP